MARALALALADPSVRALARDAMRDSRVNEHKLVLQDFVQTPRGRQMLARAAAAAGTTEQAFAATLAALPRLDFYAPFREHRKSWRATADVAVAVTFDADAPAVTAYHPDGRSSQVRASEGPPSSPLLILHPEEPKSERPELRPVGSEPRPQAIAVDAARVSSATPNTDSLGSGEASTNSTGCGDYAIIECSVEGGGGGGGGGGGSTVPTTPGYYIQGFENLENDGWFGASEIRIRVRVAHGPLYSYYPQIWEATCNDVVYPQNDVERHRWYDVEWFAFGPSSFPPFGQLRCSGQMGLGFVQVTVVEDDSGLNGGDDFFGMRAYTPGSPNPPFGAQFNPHIDTYFGADGDSKARVRMRSVP